MNKNSPLLGGGIAAAVALSLLAPAAAIADDAAPADTAPVAEAPTAAAPPGAAPAAEPETTEIVEDEASPAPESTEAAPSDSVVSEAPADVPAQDAPAPVAASSTIAAPAAFIAGRSTVTLAITDPSGAPVVNAIVDAVSRVTNTSVASALSTADGVAVLGDLEFGDYQFVVTAPLGRTDLDGAWLGGQDSATATIVTIAYGAPTSFSVQLPAETDPIGSHRVSGRVTNTAGDPIAGAQVTLYDITNAQSGGTAYTDLDGYYVITGVDHGEFIVVAERRSGYGGADLYYPGFFGGLTEADADPIWFDASSPDATGIDIQTSMFGAEGLVHVRVTDPNADPVAYATVTAHDSSGVVVVQTTTDSRGDAGFEDLEAGEEYQIIVTPPAGAALTMASFAHTVAAQREVTIPVQLGYGDLEANKDEYTFDAGVLFDSGVVEGVRANDTPGDEFQVELLTAPSYGSDFDLGADGRFTYRAADGFDGIDGFTYRLVGPDGLVSGSASVILNIEDDVPVAPIAVDDSYETAAGTVLVTDAPGVLANDIEGGYPTVRVYEVVQDVEHGTLVIDSDGSFVYTPDAGYTGTDVFLYTTEDGVSVSDPATVTITVGATASAGAGADSPGTSGLAHTGSSPWLAGLAGALVLGAGATLAAVSRRRRDA